MSQQTSGKPTHVLERPNNLQDDAANGHRDGDDWQIRACEVETSNLNLLPGEDVTPQKSSQRSAESCAESTIVDTKSHAVYCRPKCSIADRDTVVIVDLLPCLNYSRQKDCGADVGACELHHESAEEYRPYVVMVINLRCTEPQTESPCRR